MRFHGVVLAIRRWATRVEHRVRDVLYALPAPPIARELGLLAARTVKAFGRDDGSHMAAGMAYYVIFSIFPLLLGVLAIGGLIFGSEEAQVRLFDFLAEQFPGIADNPALQENIESLVRVRGALGLVSLLALFWSGSAVFGALHRTMNRVWGAVEPRAFPVRKGREVLMALGVGLVFFVSIAMSAIQGTVVDQLHVLSVPEGVIAIWRTSLVTALALLLNTVVFTFIYRFVPNTSVSISHVLPAALLAAGGFELSKYLFVWYLGSYATYDLVYGSISAVVVLMLWSYLASNILVFCGEVAHTYGWMRDNGELRFRDGLLPVKGGLRPL